MLIVEEDDVVLWSICKVI